MTQRCQNLHSPRTYLKTFTSTRFHLDFDSIPPYTKHNYITPWSSSKKSPKNNS
jgi:hypothetical protein